MRLNVQALPRDVQPPMLVDRSVVVFDVLRATTTITAALAVGVAEIQVFDALDPAAAAARAHPGARLLCGESGCLAPPGFDLGNSPGAFDRTLHAGLTVFMSTTNGTRAIVAARSTRLLLIGALVNAAAVARRLIAAQSHVTLLCAGTGGEPAMEDLLGAGAVIDAMASSAGVALEGDMARIALRLFRCCAKDLRGALAESVGGRNVLGVGLGADIDFAARLDALPLVGRVVEQPLRVIEYKD